MRRLVLAGGVALALAAPEAAHACMVCGNHGDQLLTLAVYGAFMTTPFLLAGGVVFGIRRQLKQLAAAEGPVSAAQ